MPAIIPIPAFSDNYIWLVREGRHAAVVDPGDAAPVLAYLDREGLALTAIVTTHHHGDHVGGNAALLARFPVPVFGPARETIPGRTHALAEGDEITVPGLGWTLRVLDVPGHTAGHIAYVGRDADGGDRVRRRHAVRRRLRAAVRGHAGADGGLARETRRASGGHARLLRARVHAGEPALRARGRARQCRRCRRRQRRDQDKRDRGLPTVPSTVAEERATNPFLRAGEPDVFAAAQAHAGRRLADAVDAFAVVREWKNGFR